MEEIYWITRLDSINEFLTGLNAFAISFGVICVLALVIWKLIIIISGDTKEDDSYVAYHGLKKPLLAAAIILLTTGFLSDLGLIFVPTTKEACAIYVGGSVVDYVQNNDSVKEIPDKVVTFANEYLNELIEEHNKIK